MTDTRFFLFFRIIPDDATPSRTYCGISEFLKYNTSNRKLEAWAINWSFPLLIDIPHSFSKVSESSFKRPDFWIAIFKFIITLFRVSARLIRVGKKTKKARLNQASLLYFYWRPNSITTSSHLKQWWQWWWLWCNVLLIFLLLSLQI